MSGRSLERAPQFGRHDSLDLSETRIVFPSRTRAGADCPSVLPGHTLAYMHSSIAGLAPNMTCLRLRTRHSWMGSSCNNFTETVPVMQVAIMGSARQGDTKK